MRASEFTLGLGWSPCATMCVYMFLVAKFGKPNQFFKCSTPHLVLRLVLLLFERRPVTVAILS